MAIIKIMTSKTNTCKSSKYAHYNYSNDDALPHLTKYIFNDTKGLIRNYFNTPADPQFIPAAFELAAKLHNKDTHNHRKAEHFIISLDKTESKSLGVDGLKHISDAYCQQFSDDYMLAYSIHENEILADGSIETEENLHAHIMLNPINIHNGRRLHRSNSFPREQTVFLKNLVKNELKAEQFTK